MYASVTMAIIPMLWTFVSNAQCKAVSIVQVKIYALSAILLCITCQQMEHAMTSVVMDSEYTRSAMMVTLKKVTAARVHVR